MKFMVLTFTPIRYLFVCSVLMLILGIADISGQNPGQDAPAPQPTPVTSPTPTVKVPSSEHDFFKNILKDQKAIWTSPFRLHHTDTKWGLPLIAGAAGLIASDRYTSSWVDKVGSLPPVSHGVSQGGTIYATIGTSIGIYAAGRFTNNPRLRETGLLATEAVIDSGIVTHTLKLITQRSRPNEGNGHGHFFSGGNSFPSGHATGVWSLATVVANEYHDKPIIKYGSYGLAILITMSRYSGRNHYLSDLLIGSAIGYGVGKYVYSTHHDKTLGTVIENNRLPKYFPQISPDFNPRSHTYRMTLSWNF